jgi:DNA-binding NarL/FixJ family response regulator
MISSANSVEELLSMRKRENFAVEIILLAENDDHQATIIEIETIRKQFASIKILIHAKICKIESIVSFLSRGVCAYVLKDDILSGLYQAIKDVDAFGAYISPAAAKTLFQTFLKTNNVQSNNLILTSREKELIELVVKGLSYKEMASYLNISHHTVNHHLKKLYIKMEVRSKTELVYKYLSSKSENYEDGNIK